MRRRNPSTSRSSAFDGPAPSSGLIEESEPPLVFLKGLGRARTMSWTAAREVPWCRQSQPATSLRRYRSTTCAVIGQQRAVALIKGKSAAARLKGVKGHA